MQLSFLVGISLVKVVRMFRKKLLCCLVLVSSIVISLRGQIVHGQLFRRDDAANADRKNPNRNPSDNSQGPTSGRIVPGNTSPRPGTATRPKEATPPINSNNQSRPRAGSPTGNAKANIGTQPSNNNRLTPSGGNQNQESANSRLQVGNGLRSLVPGTTGPQSNQAQQLQQKPQSNPPNLRTHQSIGNGQSNLTQKPVANFNPPAVSQPSRNPVAGNSLTNSGEGLSASDSLKTRDADPKPSSTAVAVSESEALARFGIDLKEDESGLLVSQIAPGGNGMSAGLTINDKITSIGGAPLSYKSELVEIARLLSLGDQIEIEFERGGKTEKALLQYGYSAGNESQSSSLASEDANGWSPTPSDKTERLERLVADQQKLIYELQNRIRQLESQSKSAF